jgi:hypothetical protein
LAYWQDDEVTNASYYDRFKTRVDVTEHIGVCFDNPVLWEWKSQEVYSTDYELLSNLVKEAKAKEDVNSLNALRVPAGTKNSRSVGFVK